MMKMYLCVFSNKVWITIFVFFIIDILSYIMVGWKLGQVGSWVCPNFQPGRKMVQH